MNRKYKIPVIITIILLVIIGVRYFMPTGIKEIGNQVDESHKINFDYSELKQNNKASLLMNMDTNQVIYENNMDKPLPVYSVSKVMFLATVSKEMKKNNISLKKKIKVPKLIDKVNTQGNFSSAGLKSDTTYTIEELFDGVMIPSGNDAAILLAVELFGTHEQAVAQMNADAKEWGLSQSTFVSTSGLDGKYLNKIGIKAQNGKNMMSPKDNVFLLKRVMQDYPAIMKAGSKPVSYIGLYNNKYLKLENVNEVIDGLDYGYQGVYGLKTGSNIEAYSNNIIALKKNAHNQTIATMSFGSKDRQTLYSDVKNLYDYLDTVQLINMQDKIKLNTKVGFAKNDVGFTLEKPYYLYAPKNQEFDFTIVEKTKYYNKYLNRYYGVKQYSPIGKLDFSDKGLFFGGEPINVSEAVVKDKVEKKGIVSRLFELVQTLITK